MAVSGKQVAHHMQLAACSVAAAVRALGCCLCVSTAAEIAGGSIVLLISRPPGSQAEHSTSVSAHKAVLWNNPSVACVQQGGAGQDLCSLVAAGSDGWPEPADAIWACVCLLQRWPDLQAGKTAYWHCAVRRAAQAPQPSPKQHGLPLECSAGQGLQAADSRLFIRAPATDETCLGACRAHSACAGTRWPDMKASFSSLSRAALILSWLVDHD